MGAKPTMFIGSSVEGLSVARSVQAELEYELNTTIWNQGIFGPTSSSLGALVEAIQKFDYALFIFTADDKLTLRGRTKPVVRDNVLFEFGLFLGELGPERTFFLISRTAKPRLPSDLQGVTPLTFDDSRASEEMRAAVGPACTEIRRSVGKLGTVVRSQEPAADNGSDALPWVVPLSSERDDPLHGTWHGGWFHRGTPRIVHLVLRAGAKGAEGVMLILYYRGSSRTIVAQDVRVVREDKKITVEAYGYRFVEKGEARGWHLDSFSGTHE